MKTRTQSLSLVVAMTLAVSTAAHAASIAWTSDVFDNVTDVSTTGSLITALNLGNNTPHAQSNNGNPTAAVAVNGVTFASTPGDGSDLFIVNSSDFHDVNTYNDVNVITGLSAVDANALLDPLAFGPGIGNSLARVSGLTVGNKYELQLLMARGTYNFGHSTPSGNATETYTLNGVATAPPVVVTGTFIATEASQDIHVAQTAAFNAEVNAFQLRDVTGPTIIGDAGNNARWQLTVPTLGAYDNQAVPPSNSANFYYDANGDLDFNAIDGDSTGNTNASLAVNRLLSDGDVMNFYFEDFDFDLESVAGITLSGVDIEQTDGTIIDNLSVTEGSRTLFTDSNGLVWQIVLDVIDGGGLGDIVTNTNSEPGGGGPDEQFTLTFTQIPTPAALPAGLGMLAIIAMRRRR
ncbi:MAG: hypothetical protein H8E63_11055 [Proteobacteria bacterium]|nr:hypothetical protein [Pseudomonadota bacterium]